MKSLILGALMGTLALPVAAAQPRMSFDQAVDLCTERARKLALIPHGPYGDEPPRVRVEQEYRACVYANSRQYPSTMPQYRVSILTLLRDALK